MTDFSSYGSSCVLKLWLIYKLWKIFMSITIAVLFMGKNTCALKILTDNIGSQNEKLMNWKLFVELHEFSGNFSTFFAFVHYIKTLNPLLWLIRIRTVLNSYFLSILIPMIQLHAL